MSLWAKYIEMSYMRPLLSIHINLRVVTSGVTQAYILYLPCSCFYINEMN